MSGRLIILPKKSWNVWDPKNIAKVRKDEADAAAKEKEEEEAQRAGAMAANVDAMKRRVAGLEAEAGAAPAPAPAEALEHVNFFEKEERAAAAALGGKTPEEVWKRRGCFWGSRRRQLVR
mmetsp:Transcript_18152/g.56716  ORF Transcript_18152/g.56716 Transcript_18152/m.56716 type:complete len:120 (+) Transcript_18152:342-701(+)